MRERETERQERNHQKQTTVRVAEEAEQSFLTTATDDGTRNGVRLVWLVEQYQK